MYAYLDGAKFSLFHYMCSVFLVVNLVCISDVNNKILVDWTYIKRLQKFSWVVWRMMLAPQWGWYGAESPYKNFEHFKVVVLA